MINPSAINRYHFVLRSKILGLVELIRLSNVHLNVDPLADVTTPETFSSGYNKIMSDVRIVYLRSSHLSQLKLHLRLIWILIVELLKIRHLHVSIILLHVQQRYFHLKPFAMNNVHTIVPHYFTVV